MPNPIVSSRLFSLPAGLTTALAVSIAAPNGFTYAYNQNGGNVWKIETDNPANAVIIGTLPGGNAFAHTRGCYDPINNEIFIPAGITNGFFYIINCATDAISTIGSTLGTGVKYGDAFFYNGQIFGAPAGVLDRYVYTCSTKTFAFFPTFTGTNKYLNACNIGTDIYFGSENRDFILRLNTLTNTISELPTRLSTSVIGSSLVYLASINSRLILFRVLPTALGVSGVYEYNLATNAITSISGSIQGGNFTPFTLGNRIFFNGIFSGNPNPYSCSFDPIRNQHIFDTTLNASFQSVKILPSNGLALNITNGGIIRYKYSRK